MDIYASTMYEVKNRIKSITDILEENNTTSYPATNVEFMCLQIRKVLELISMASLVANKDKLEQAQSNFQKFWKADLILKDIERLNPEFYPVPILETPTFEAEVKTQISIKTDGYLTKKEFIKVYEKCGGILHANNPFGSKSDLKFYNEQIPIWLNKIISLLDKHLIKLADLDDFYIIHMKHENDDSVHCYNFGKIENNRFVMQDKSGN